MKPFRTSTLAVLLTLSCGLSVAHGANSAYRNLVISDGAVVYYEFDETTGTTAFDTISASNGTYVGAVNQGAASGPGLGTAADLAGGYVDVPVVGFLANSTIEVWLQLDAGGEGCCTSIASAGNWTTNALHWNLTGGNVFEHAVNNQGNVNTAAGSFLTDGSTWYHLVVTDSGGVTNSYVNGVLVADTGDHSGAGIDYGNTNFQIGAWNGERLLNGRVDEFAIYDTVLSASQIQAHYAAGLVPEPSSALLLLVGGALTLRRRRK